MTIKNIFLIFITYIIYVSSTHRPTPTPTYEPTKQFYTEQPIFTPAPSTIQPTPKPFDHHIITLQPTPNEITLQPTPSNFDPTLFTSAPTVPTDSPTPAPTETTVWTVGDSFIVFAIVILIAVILILYLYFFTPKITKMESVSEGVETQNHSESTPLIGKENDNDGDTPNALHNT